MWMSTTEARVLDHLATEARKDVKVIPSRTYESNFDVLVSENDTVEFLNSVPDETFQLIVTSPPYNIGKPYEERKAFREYLQWQESVIKECVRVLKRGGSLCWEVGNYVEKREVFPLDAFFYRM